MLTKRQRVLIVILFLLAGFFISTPRYFDPSGNRESQKTWVFARILAETGGFPVISLGPLYAVYLQVFRLFDYPLSVRLEYISTHLIVEVALYLMLLRFLSWPLALFLTCAWIPYLVNLDPGHLVLGIAFVCLYFRGPSWGYNQGYFPLTLLAALLCHSAYLPFLAGHTVGEIIRRKFLGGNIASKPKEGLGFLIAKGFLFLLIVLTVVNPSKCIFNNNMVINPKYCPIPMKDALTSSFFEMETWDEVVRDVPRSLWITQDWYFVTPRIFKGAKTIWQAVIRSPDIVGKNVIEHIGQIPGIPRFFMSGLLRGSLNWIPVILFPLCFIGMSRFYNKNIEYFPEILALITGSFFVLLAIFLTCSILRYVMTLLPVALVCLCFIGQGFDTFLSWRECLQPMLIRNKSIFFTGVAMIGLALFYNPLILGFVYPIGVSNNLSSLSVGFDIFFLVCGILFIADSLIPEKISVHNDFSRKLTAVVVIFSASTVLLTVGFPLGVKTQINAIINNEGLFDGVLNLSYKELLKGLGRDSKVLADDNWWLMAFGPVKINNIYGPMDLPPYEDKTGETRALLNSLDAIWVTSIWTFPNPDTSTQGYLRYRLHIEPFLKEAVQEHHWVSQELPGYGTIYRRKM